jgi:hypothetical protein
VGSVAESSSELFHDCEIREGRLIGGQSCGWTSTRAASTSRSRPSSSTHRLTPVVARQGESSRRDHRRTRRAPQARCAGSACRTEATHDGGYVLTGGRASSPQLVVLRLRRRRHLTAQFTSARANLRSSQRRCGAADGHRRARCRRPGAKLRGRVGRKRRRIGLSQLR